MAREANQDLSRVPKWAQDKINGLEKRVTELKNHVAELSSPHPGTNVAIDQHHIYPDVELPEFSQVLFYLGDERDRWHDAIEVRISRNHPGQLEIRGPGEGLRIIPSTYNGVRMELDK